MGTIVVLTGFSLEKGFIFVDGENNVHMFCNAYTICTKFRCTKFLKKYLKNLSDLRKLWKLFIKG